VSQSSRTCDVVVVGFGGAGAAAAIEAHDAGARVLVIEKAAAGGGNTQVAGGNIRIVRDPAKMVRHFRALSEQGTDVESIEAHVRGLTALPTWIEKLGGVLSPDERGVGTMFVDGPPYCPREYSGSAFPAVEGAGGLGGRYRWPMQNGHDRGEAAFAMLERAVVERGIEVISDCAARALIRESATGRVTGMTCALADDDDLQVSATSGVILACGGYAWDSGLQRDYLGAAMPSSSPPHRNTGDGVRMAEAIGAALWHMRAAVLQLGLLAPGFDASFPIRIRERGFIIVDQHARRFCDETRLDGHDGGILLQDRDMRTITRLRLPSVLIFDERTRLAGPIVGTDRGYNRGGGWSSDNGAEVEKGWIERGITAAELARKFGLDPQDLEATVSAFNRDIEKDADAFGRRSADGWPLSGPFYGVRLWPCIVNTQGGPRRAPDGRVLDPFGAAIPGLFGAGELGSIWTSLYPGGGNFGEAFVSGRAAGATAAR
jgi:succinate dehydrogenase/fumarate reductase flavoprotein subunit